MKITMPPPKGSKQQQHCRQSKPKKAHRKPAGTAAPDRAHGRHAGQTYSMFSRMKPRPRHGARVQPRARIFGVGKSSDGDPAQGAGTKIARLDGAFLRPKRSAPRTYILTESHGCNRAGIRAIYRFFIRVIRAIRGSTGLKALLQNLRGSQVVHGGWECGTKMHQS